MGTRWELIPGKPFHSACTGKVADLQQLPVLLCTLRDFALHIHGGFAALCAKQQQSVAIWESNLVYFLGYFHGASHNFQASVLSFFPSKNSI